MTPGASERGNWKVATAEPAEGETEYTLTVPKLARISQPGTSGLRNLADAAPRVTREMVTGTIGSSPSFHGDNLVVQYCALCGAAISAAGPEGSAIAAIEDYTEVHRAWHDGLERLLEQL